MKKALRIVFLIIFFIIFCLFEIYENSGTKVIEIYNATEIAVDFNGNGKADDGERICIPNIKTFTSNLSANQTDISKIAGISKTDAINIGYLSDELAKQILSGKNIKLEYKETQTPECRFADIYVDGQNYSDILLDSGLVIYQDKIHNQDLFKENLDYARKLNLVILNRKSGKYHKLDCKFGLNSSDYTILPVKDAEGELDTNLYTYLKEEQRSPWWSAIISFPFKCLGWVMSLFKEEEEGTDGGVNPFQLTKDEDGVVKALNERIAVSVDKKTSLISLSVTMQDPLISATMTDTVMAKLQDYITEYRTNKARHDLDFTQKLYDEAQKKYYDAQQAYADYVDMNQNISLRSVQTRQERLQNEMNLAYNLYNQTAQQLQLAKAKVQENTPVYTIVQAATVPLKASKPSKLMILVGFVFLAGVGSVGWILFGRNIWTSLKQSIRGGSGA